MEKLTLDEFKKMYLDLENAYDKLYEKVKNGTAQEEIEKEDEVLSLEFYKKITSYDLSDIPASLLRFSLSFPVDIIDFSKTHANIDFSVTLLDYNCKYNFKGCNITNLEKVDYNYLINNKDSFDEETINKYSYLFEELPVLEIGNIKIKYLNTNEGLEKAKELYNYLQDKYFLINDINEIKIIPCLSKLDNSTMFINIRNNVVESFYQYERINNKVYDVVASKLKYGTQFDDLMTIKVNSLNLFNSYFNSKYDSSNISEYIYLLLYYYKDTELLNEYINNHNIEAVIDKYFKPLLVEFMNYYFDNINDDFLNTNIGSFSDFFWVNLKINSKKQEETNEKNSHEDIYNLSEEETTELLLDIFQVEDKESNKDLVDSLSDDEVTDALSEMLHLGSRRVTDEDKISTEKILDITKEILFEIDSSGELISIFNYALANNKINLNGDDNYYKINEDLISIKNENNYSTVHALIHEFFHYLSNFYSKGNQKQNPYLQEIASIFFESYAIKYMVNKYGIDESKIDFIRERDYINKINNTKVDDILNLFKIKKERNIVFEDIANNEITISLELLSILNGIQITDKYYFEKKTLDMCLPFIKKSIMNTNELLDNHSKVLISYTLGTELAKKYSSNPECIDMFLTLAKCAESAEYNEAEIYRDLLENLEKKSKKTTYV